MKFKINSKFNIKIFFSNSKLNIKMNSKFNIKIFFSNSKLNKTHMIFTGSRDTNQGRLFPTVPMASSSPSQQMETKLKKKP